MAYTSIKSAFRNDTKIPFVCHVEFVETCEYDESGYGIKEADILN